VSGKNEAKETFLIGELAALAGVSRDTLRHYERVGVLPAPFRAANGYRLYRAGALERVRLVRRALAVGFSLDELAQILAARRRGETPCRRVRTLAADKLETIRTRLGELEKLRDELAAVIADWDRRLAGKPEDEAAGLLETLGAEAPQDGGQAAKKRRAPRARR
jgi:DNA-binding transcriptional MerR regulator